MLFSARFKPINTVQQVDNNAVLMPAVEVTTERIKLTEFLVQEYGVR